MQLSGVYTAIQNQPLVAQREILFSGASQQTLPSGQPPLQNRLTLRELMGVVTLAAVELGLIRGMTHWDPEKFTGGDFARMMLMGMGAVVLPGLAYLMWPVLQGPSKQKPKP